MAATNHLGTQHFKDQPARFLLLDLTYPWSSDINNDLFLAVKNVLSLSSCSKGTPRIPVFGFGTMDEEYKLRHGCSIVKDDLKDIIIALDSLSNNNDNVQNTGVKVNSYAYTEVLTEALSNILEDFNSKRPANIVKNYWPSQIYITLITRKKEGSVAIILSSILENNLFEKIEKTITLVQLKSSQEFNEVEYNFPSFGKILVTPDSYFDLEMLFKDWFLETKCDDEHLRIILDKDLDLIIKCDVRDSILRPLSLPYEHRFSLSNELILVASNTKESVIYELEVEEKTNMAGLDNKFIYGRTKIIYPTQCSKFSENELRLNRDIFKSLCLELRNLEQGLLAKLNYGRNTDSEMNVYFFITSDGEKFFLNNIASAELLLPEPSQSLQDDSEIPQETQSAITEYLNRIPYSEEYLPEKHPCGLYKAIQCEINTSPSKSHHQKIQPATKRKTRKQSSTSSEVSTLAETLPPGEYVPEFLNGSVAKRKCRKSNARKRSEELDCLHPALLTPEIKNKYRKKKSSVYELSEPDEF